MCPQSTCLLSTFQLQHAPHRNHKSPSKPFPRSHHKLSIPKKGIPNRIKRREGKGILTKSKILGTPNQPKSNILIRLSCISYKQLCMQKSLGFLFLFYVCEGITWFDGIPCLFQLHWKVGEINSSFINVTCVLYRQRI